MRDHIVKVPVYVRDPKTGERRRRGKRVIRPGIFSAVTRQELKEGKRSLKFKMVGEKALRDEEKTMLLKPCVTGIAILLVAFAVLGGVAVVLNLPHASGWWVAAKFKNTWAFYLTRDPDAQVFFFSVLGLGLLVGVGMGWNSYRAKIVRATTQVNKWRKNPAQTPNDVLIHLLSEKVDPLFEPKYSAGEVYTYAGKQIPEGIIRKWRKTIPARRLPLGLGKVLPESVRAKMERPERRVAIPLEWERFKRDGQFEVNLGEVYERDGRFNATPSFVKIPTPGLYTGIFVVGPTGSGKSQSVLLSIIDQFLGYYAWVEDERRLWLRDMPAQLQAMQQLSSTQSGATKAGTDAKIAALRGEMTERRAKYDRGEDAFFGHEACFIFLIEPKNEMWASLKSMCEHYGRAHHYLELGTVREKYDLYMTNKVRLDQAAMRVYAYHSEDGLIRKLADWLSNFADENAIPVSKKGIGELPAKIFGASSGPGSALVAIKQGFRALAAFPREQLQADPNEEIPYEDQLNQLAVRHCTPFCFPWTAGDELVAGDGLSVGAPNARLVGPLGFGTRAEPWVHRHLNRLKNEGYQDAQAIYVSVFGAVANVYGALGGNFAGVGDDAGMSEGVFTREVFGQSVEPNLAQGLQAAGLREGGHPACETLMPKINPAGLLFPKALSRNGEADGDGDTDAEDVAKKRASKDASKLPIVERIANALADMPATRREGAVIRSVMRLVAPPAKGPGELRESYRNRVALWEIERERTRYRFVDTLARGFASPLNGPKAMVDDGLEGRSMATRLYDSFGKIAPGGMVEATVVWFLHHPATGNAACDALAREGWSVTRRLTSLEESGQSNEMRAFDWHYESETVPPDLDGLDAKASASGAEVKIELVHWHQRNRRVRALRNAAILAAALNSRHEVYMADRVRMDFVEGLRSIAREAIRLAQPVRRDALLASLDALTITRADAEDIWVLVDEMDRQQGLRYTYDPRVDTGEQISDHPEDIGAMVDPFPRDIRLGPWDALWSEGIGERLWEPLRTTVREILSRAMSTMGQAEARFVRDLLGDDAARAGSERGIAASHRERRERVLTETLNYLTALEDYLTILPRLHKADLPYAYGYKDFGGSGDCQGLSKFNPLHNPNQNPNQLAASLMGVLNRGAGSGDTSFWADAGIMVTENMVSLLRASQGYVTVAGLFQAVTSDAFCDLMMDRASRRIADIERAQMGSGANPQGEILERIWAGQRRLRPQDLKEACVALPEAARRLLPRVESEIELREIRENLAVSQAFITKDWRGSTGMFSDPQVGGTVKLNLLQQLTPLTKDIGGYAFSPEDADSISFPTFEQARTNGNVIVTRFQQTIDPKLGGLVVGMAKMMYQAMVLGAKGRITTSEGIMRDISTSLPRMRKELAELRQNLASVEGYLRAFDATRSNRHAVEVAVRGQIREAIKAFHANGGGDASALADQIARRLLEAEQAGLLAGGALTHEVAIEVKGDEGGGVGRAQAALGAQHQGLYLNAESILTKRLGQILTKRDEENASKRDLRNRYRQRIWVLRQEILNLLSRRDELANNTRLCLFCIDEAQGYVVFDSKGGSISEEKFLGEARAGCSVNIYCTQAPAAIKSAASEEQFQYFISNMRTQIVLGVPNKPDQEMISDLWQGEEVLVDKGGGFSVQYEGVERDGATGQVTGAKATGGSRNYSTERQFKKYVEGWQLRDVPTFRSYAAIFDGTKQHKPQMLAHPPYYIIRSEKCSEVDGRPLTTKPFVSLLRDGDISLPPLEEFDEVEMLRGLKQNGVDVDDDLAEAERRKSLLERENGKGAA